MSKSTEHHAESKRAEQLRRRLADVALIRHQVNELWDHYDSIIPEWANKGRGQPSDLVPWIKPGNKLLAVVDVLQVTEDVLCAEIREVEAEATRTSAEDGEAPDGDPDRERLTAQLLNDIGQLDTDELAEVGRAIVQHLHDRDAEQEGDRP